MTYYKKGDWNAICDICGFQFKASQLRKTWDNLYVCKEDYEPRHPQEAVRVKTDDQSVPWTRPQGEFQSAGGIITLSDSATPAISTGMVYKTGGTTTITNFTSGTVGQTIRIISAHDITIDHGASIKLSTGQDFDMKYGDSLTLRMESSGVWTEAERTVL